MTVLTRHENLYKVHTDEELVQLFIETQRNSYFEELYERYSDKVYRKCLSLIKDPAKAEDFTHDIFLKLILKLGTYKENARFSTWLYSITYNYCMDQLRITKKRGEVYSDESVEVSDETDLNTIFDQNDIEARRLMSAMDQMSTEEKSLLMMKYLDDLSIREIAEIFKITESAAKMRLLRSREKLRIKYLETIVFLGLLFAKLFELLKMVR
ncbi:RNA polymerase sigma factor [Arundinibacter roseus]|uniref:RNA polymerase sigma factor n=1 Tax=Arundinibacter roseus TaxID=2070510 RepID=A0A4R4K7S9_9BACT|nr:RNA polymerase sigma factor [Arundinibacter roseus]